MKKPFKSGFFFALGAMIVYYGFKILGILFLMFMSTM